MSEAEKAAYRRGYAAGRKRVQKDVTNEKRAAQRAAFRQRAFLVALPACIAAKGWARGDKPITSMTDRVSLAWEAADEAMKGYY